MQVRGRIFRAPWQAPHVVKMGISNAKADLVLCGGVHSHPTHPPGYGPDAYVLLQNQPLNCRSPYEAIP